MKKKKHIKQLISTVFLQLEIKTPAFRSQLCPNAEANKKQCGNPHFGSFLNTTYKQIAAVFSNCCVYSPGLGTQQYFSYVGFMSHVAPEP